MNTSGLAPSSGVKAFRQLDRLKYGGAAAQSVQLESQQEPAYHEACVQASIVHALLLGEFIFTFEGIFVGLPRLSLSEQGHIHSLARSFRTRFDLLSNEQHLLRHVM